MLHCRCEWDMHIFKENYDRWIYVRLISCYVVIGELHEHALNWSYTPLIDFVKSQVETAPCVVMDYVTGLTKVRMLSELILWIAKLMKSCGSPPTPVSAVYISHGYFSQLLPETVEINRSTAAADDHSQMNYLDFCLASFPMPNHQQDTSTSDISEIL